MELWPKVSGTTGQAQLAVRATAPVVTTTGPHLPPPPVPSVGCYPNRGGGGGGLLHAVIAAATVARLTSSCKFFKMKIPVYPRATGDETRGVNFMCSSPGWHEVPLPRLVLWHRSRLGHMQRPPRFLPPYTSPDLVGGAVWRVRSGA